jgi:hypothetical protein
MARKQSRTRKHTRKSKAPEMTIPQLRASLQTISSIGESLIKSVKRGVLKLNDAATEFTVAWKKVFGRALEKNKALCYLKHLMGSGKGTRRKQRGGQAPLGYDMRLPEAGLPYGKFLPYVSGGFVNPEPGMRQSCGQQVGVLPYPGTGSNQVGGGLFDGFNAIFSRPVMSQNPSSGLMDALDTVRGQPTGPGPESWQTAYNYRLPPIGQQPIPVAGVLMRTIANDIKSPGA